MSRDAWEAALTKMEDELDLHEESVRLGNSGVVPPWEPPTDLGPLPPELGDRVTHLVGRVKLLSTFVEYAMKSAENDLAHLERQHGRSGTTAAVSLYLDSSV